MKESLVIREDIRIAIEKGQPVVALESTIISHGMPYPQNLKTALECESIIERHGAIPATTAILDGTIKIGLTPDEIERIAKGEETVEKASRRDIPYLLAMEKNGALTVAATMIAANLAGIRLFATGGIGGVHRGAEHTFDVSADLEELASTDVCVVSAGIKSILDLPKTMEVLETKGVPVIGYKTDYLPEFYTRGNEIRVPMRLDSPSGIADLLKQKWELGLSGGVMVANPIPEKNAYPKKTIDKAIHKALVDMENDGIGGKEQTPYLLGRIKEITGGESLRANISLVYNNCELAARIACAFAERV